ncbi:F-actin-capping protein subunit alpha [Coemansia spiralis]|uniref:F-actin-capping protein subunit alpha n=2 Tax=Coemansia TaxID=4863 RepID=A0A9W8G1V4_9FUNG|nr:F-actin-capping protein subunit alpha [Coemansia umbellata]KAJ2621349.1 F-actin-capping protein subunit alpha [Coemansia sp. RSA 1358]KAJ2670895.1 F-actin-capping protein subunit alpha [Coemansia spiralis]
MSSKEQISKAVSLLLSSPPGEVDDVFNDIRGIVNDDDALQEQIEPVLAESNMQQFLVVDVPDRESKVLITPYNQIEEGRYLDPNTQAVFAFDHLRRVASDPQDHEDSSEDDGSKKALRAALQQELNTYVEAHYPEGAASVFVHEGSLVSCIVSNKFSPNNYWNGSWRAVWSFNAETGQLNGSIKVKVHYFEDGNVQLDTQSDFATDVPGSPQPADSKSMARKVAKLIKGYEAEFQQGVNDGYRQLSEKTFKGLRRTLPVTRSKIDWEKIANYKLGGELANAEN